MKTESTYDYLEGFLNELQSKGRYAVTLEEVKRKFDVSEKAILQNLYRLKSKKQLAQVRQGFYVIVHPQYSRRGMIPATLFIADLMEYLNREYYVCLFSAAALHGAGHQQPMQFQVMTGKPSLRNIQNTKLSIHFFVKSTWEEWNIVRKKTDAGYIHVSSPALTAFDLLQYHKQIGGLNRIVPILEDLVETIRIPDLNRTVAGQRTPEIQRLGYILEQIGHERLSSALYKRLDEVVPREIPLSLAHKNREGERDKKWNLILNTEIDF